MGKLYLVILLCLLTGSTFSQELEPRKNGAFQPGEKLTYKLKYGFLTAAEATLEVQETDVKFDNKPVFHLVAQGKTSGSFDIFYKVRDRYDSYIDKTELTPYLYTENIRESNYRRTDHVRFYQEQKKIVGEKGTFKGVNPTFDLISAYYFARSLDLTNISPGDKIRMNYFLKDEVSPFEIQYVGKERIKTPLGYFNCLKFSPTIQAGRIFKKDSKLYLWITDDGNRIPVKAQVEILLGSVTLEIQDATGMKYPSTATDKK
ncbi:DUF3108 domain-containing protein [Hufsiella ginkgonis]|uniref:DUF3108 domain-containing protein n=1 Tax=Hufsiella ginkgonis TaxID=2695274 RepID=A0A7K1XVA8_9SPHI|nr:DUF3108 domain-containing protein [Hufsiella ginkgonis]MXV14446.1 DUF3108 domain-containing protein [Hufsiella ginkgonis]